MTAAQLAALVGASNPERRPSTREVGDIAALVAMSNMAVI